MIAVDVGRWALLLSLVLAAYAVVVSVVGAQRRSEPLIASGRNAVVAVAALVTVAVGSLLALLLTRSFQVAYVWSTVSRALPTVYVFSALWAGQEGSLLFWLWLVSLLGMVVMLRPRAWNRALQPYAGAVIAATQLLFAVLLVFVSKPFALLSTVPLDGQGMNPLLENPGMIYHPPILFLGYAAYTIPFAYAIAALASRNFGSEWIRRTRLWNLFAWLALGLGILLGAQWAYAELGWGGYWAWDPVENASLIPWLVGTASLHSVMVQERRGALKSWNIVLVTLTYALCIFATFVTRSGLIQSVHAFEKSPIGYFFLGFLGLVLVVTAGLMLWRRKELGAAFEVTTLASREAMLLLTILLLGGIAAAVFIGTVFPSLAELLSGTPVALGQSFFARVFGPLALATLLVLAVCPLLAWNKSATHRLGRALIVPAALALLFVVVAAILGIRLPVALIGFAVCVFVAASTLMDVGWAAAVRRRSTREPIPLAALRLVGKHRRRYGGYTVHLAIVVIAAGLIGSSVYSISRVAGLKPGLSATLHGYTFRYVDYSVSQTDIKQRYVARLEVSRSGRILAVLAPERNYHLNVDQWVTEVAIRPSLVEDVYVSLSGLQADGVASFSIQLHPMVTWLWIGGSLLLLGALLAMWPPREPVRSTARRETE